MSIRLLTLLLFLVQVAIGLAALLVLLFFVVHAFHGGRFTTNWPISAQAPVASFAFANNAGALRIDHGTLALASRDWRPEFVQLVCVWIFAAGANLAIQRLKDVLAAIAAGKPFGADIVRGLRVIGYLVLGWVGLDILDALIAQPLILANAVPSDAAIALSSSISKPADAFAHVFRMDFHISFLKIAAGLFALALAQAFAIGRSLAEESEAIV